MNCGGKVTMKKNIGSKLAFYPMLITVVGAMNGDQPTWTLAGHLGIIGHDRVMVSLAAPNFINGKINYNTLKPVLFEFSTYHYLRTGDALDGTILYINVMNRLSVKCDCDTSSAELDMNDIGIIVNIIV